MKHITKPYSYTEYLKQEYVLIFYKVLAHFKNKAKFCPERDQWFLYEKIQPLLWSPLPKQRFLGLIQEFIYEDVVSSCPEALTNYKLARNLEYKMSHKLGLFKENNLIFLSNSEIINIHAYSTEENARYVALGNFVKYTPVEVKKTNKKLSKEELITILEPLKKSKLYNKYQ